MIYHLGIDPGASGGLAVIHEDGSHCGLVYSKMGDTETDTAEFIRWCVGQYPNLKACIEAVNSMPGQGVASSFKFGQSLGFLRGLLVGLQIPMESVRPQKWQKAMGCMSRGDKNVTKAKAQELFPEVRVTHALADALLIAEYHRRLHKGIL